MASSSRSQLPSWPPTLSSTQLAHLTAQATDYALAHGLVYRPAASSSDQGPLSTHVHHAPISLFPSPFPRAAVEQAVQLQGILNELYARVALDDDFLQRVIGGNVAKVDEFQHGLWQVYQEVKKLGQEPVHHLGLFRSDYLLHADPSSSSSQPSIRQVEFNTISSSFGPLCAKVGELHRFLLQQTGYYGVAADVLQQQHLTQNMALSVLVDGLAEGHRAYTAGRGQSSSPQSDPRILIVVQEKERNAFDQRWLEYELLQRHGIRSIRRTFTSLISDASVASSSDRALRLRDEASPEDFLEISVVYYRSGYTPTDYTSDAHWELRLDLERSQAIKCPTVALQLAGAKKVQQVLSEPGVVESFFEGSKRFSSPDVAQLRQSWSFLYPLDETSELGREGLRLAQEESQRFVMKPQREGGGNNIYREEIPKALAAMSKRDQSKSNNEPKEREGYILMELIQPPTGLGNYLIRPPAPAASSSGGAEVVLDPSSKESHPEGLTSAECRLSADVVSELGIYGVSLFRRGQDGKGLDETGYYNEPKAGSFDATKAPYLLRTKGRESDEGGVAVGFSVLDSVVLI